MDDESELDDVLDGLLDEQQVVFTNCNVCGRQLIMADEEACGMCQICMNE